MKKLFLILLFPFLLSAQSIWYVIPGLATGNDTGRDWTNAWKTFDSTGFWGAGDGINWNIIEPGDTIYVSGGSGDSVVYKTNDNPPYYDYEGFAIWDAGSFAGGNPVIITKGWQSGHNGDVYFVMEDDTVTTGTATSTQTNRLIDASANFTANYVGLRVWNIDSLKNSYATIDSIETTTRVRLTSHIIQSDEDYLIIRPFSRVFDIVGTSNIKFVNLNFYNLATPYFSISNVVS